MVDHPSLVKPKNPTIPTEEVVSEMKDAKAGVDELTVRMEALTESAKTLNRAVRETVQRMDALEDLEKQALELLIKRLERLS